MRRTVETTRTAPRGDLAYWSRTGERLIAIVDYTLRSVTSILAQHARWLAEFSMLSGEKKVTQGVKMHVKKLHFECVQLGKCRVFYLCMQDSPLKWEGHAVSLWGHYYPLHRTQAWLCILNESDKWPCVLFIGTFSGWSLINRALCFEITVLILFMLELVI